MGHGGKPYVKKGSPPKNLYKGLCTIKQSLHSASAVCLLLFFGHSDYGQRCKRRHIMNYAGVFYKEIFMANKMTIWNMALGFIGTRTVASEDERTLEAVQCKLYWDSARRGALRDFPWNFAQRRAWLALVPMPKGYEEQYAHAYALPQDMLHALRILPDGKEGASFGQSTQGEAEEGGRFILVYDSERKQQVLLCHTARALLAYTADVEDVSLFDDLFIHMLARKLAAYVAVSLLKNNAAKVKELEELYRMAVPSAVQADAGEGREKIKADTWLAARNGMGA